MPETAGKETNEHVGSFICKLFANPYALQHISQLRKYGYAIQNVHSLLLLLRFSNNNCFMSRPWPPHPALLITYRPINKDKKATPKILSPWEANLSALAGCNLGPCSPRPQSPSAPVGLGPAQRAGPRPLVMQRPAGTPGGVQPGLSDGNVGRSQHGSSPSIACLQGSFA